MNGLAVAGFVVSLVSLLLNFWGTVGLVGAVLSGVGLSQVGHMQQRGKGLAIAGLVIGIFSILWAILLMTGLIHISTYWYMR